MSNFLFRREAVKQQLLGETETREKSKKGTLLCAKSHKKKKKKIPYSSAFNDGMLIHHYNLLRIFSLPTFPRMKPRVSA